MLDNNCASSPRGLARGRGQGLGFSGRNSCETGAMRQERCSRRKQKRACMQGKQVIEVKNTSLHEQLMKEQRLLQARLNELTSRLEAL